VSCTSKWRYCEFLNAWSLAQWIRLDPVFGAGRRSHSWCGRVIHHCCTCETDTIRTYCEFLPELLPCLITCVKCMRITVTVKQAMPLVTFARWRASREEASVQFKYWITNNLPPSDAFLIHVKRAVYQAAHCWSQSAETASSAVHDPATWSWCESDQKWTPVWMTLPEVSDTCRDLIRCSCKKACTSHCKCTQAYLPCTGLCHCGGES